MLRQGENQKLTSYGWVDKDGGVTRIANRSRHGSHAAKGLSGRADGGNALNVVHAGQLLGADNGTR